MTAVGLARAAFAASFVFFVGKDAFASGGGIRHAHAKAYLLAWRHFRVTGLGS